jgi:hypothetical protein
VPEDDAIPVAISRPDTKNGPAIAPRAVPPRGVSPAERLIVPRSETGLANDLLDEAFDDLARDPVKPALDSAAALRPPARPAKLPLPAPIDEPGFARRGGAGEGQRGGSDEREVVMEADEPPTIEKRPSQIASLAKPRAIGDHSEPEISIERFVELEVEEPLNEPTSERTNERTPDRGVDLTGDLAPDRSDPEIMILTPGRAITADDTQHVAGSIDSPEPAKTTR